MVKKQSDVMDIKTFKGEISKWIEKLGWDYPKCHWAEVSQKVGPDCPTSEAKMCWLQCPCPKCL
jgi:hypothetical protein